jgi:hypothetical protein
MSETGRVFADMESGVIFEAASCAVIRVVVAWADKCLWLLFTLGRNEGVCVEEVGS